MNDKGGLGGLGGPGGLDGSLKKLLDEAQNMQERMKKAQEDLTKVSVEGKAGGGMVKIYMNGRHEVTRVIIAKTLVEGGEDVSILEDLVAAAINDATRKVEVISKEAIQKLTAGLNIPGEFLEGGEGGEQG